MDTITDNGNSAIPQGLFSLVAKIHSSKNTLYGKENEKCGHLASLFPYRLLVFIYFKITPSLLITFETQDAKSIKCYYSGKKIVTHEILLLYLLKIENMHSHAFSSF